MKAFSRIFIAVLVLFAMLCVGANVYIFSLDGVNGRPYRVDVERAAAEIEENGRADISKYESITAIEKLTDKNKDRFYGGNSDYLIRQIGDDIYRFDYTASDGYYLDKTAVTVNVILSLTAVVVIVLMLYIRNRLLVPFFKYRDMPYQLSKGNLNIPLKENKHKFFGRFVWGMDMLRENLETHKANELKLQSEKKKLILSISHDIKLPLSAIKLYSKALEKRLYEGEDKQQEIAQSINRKADEIEGFVSQIVKASNEDFLQLSVKESEFYLSEIVGKISEYYADKLKLLKIDFSVGKYSDCILKGDADRAVEVLQNIVENAVKYGDGGFIDISFSDEEDCRLITVSNSGCTLALSELPHIFDSFWRGSNAENVNDGSGLGLYIARQLMNKMGGEVFATCKDGVMKVTSVFRKF